MPLEATMIVIDNSEYMRNGDYQPSRFDAQADAINAVFNAKVDSNPENSVGIMTMAGKGFVPFLFPSSPPQPSICSPEVLVTNTKDLGQILQAIHSTRDKIGGAADIPTAIAVAQLALKHRQNKNLRQRIIVFVGSPLQGQAADKSSMDRLAKKLKKNNVAVDFIAYGDGIAQEEQPILRSFVENATSGDNSYVYLSFVTSNLSITHQGSYPRRHYIAVPPGPHLLSDIVISSPILAGDRSIPEEAMGGAPAPGAVPGGTNDFEFGVDPSLDPELAMVMSFLTHFAKPHVVTSLGY